ncbi:restriction endonuclease subunit S [Alteromonas flava]|uniref:restriction endonuclease subunit S n=1 Tax=Alteromonas flava TaxID=2048003 RepID=UPI000C29066F|nr:restriction endonuclease subunit S [Alteromonas flava]
MFKATFSSLCNDDTLRIDCKFNKLMDLSGYDIFDSKRSNLVRLKEILIPYYKLFEFEENRLYQGVPTGKEYTNEFGDITTTQLITKEDRPNRLKYHADQECILISSLKGARAPALMFDFDLAEYVFSNGFYIFKVAKNWNQEFVLYMLRTKRLKSILDKHIYRGIGISSYKEVDLLNLSVPHIDRLHQNEAIEKIKPIKAQILELKNKKKSTAEILNEVFSEYFNISLEAVNELDKERVIVSAFNKIGFNNAGIRSSFRWNKLQEIQEFIYKDIDCIETLGRFIISTKNGWSPVSVESGDGIGVLGQEHFSLNGTLNLMPAKFTEITRKNISDFFIQKEDFFVSRGNTVDLVALASIVETDVDENLIFPDLYIKVVFDESKVNKKYLAYLFNSFFGRLYFKYVAKGKNQTMVKVSATELNNFRLPIPGIEAQEFIVNRINEVIEAQEAIDEEIKLLQIKIDSIIETVINSHQE